VGCGTAAGRTWRARFQSQWRVAVPKPRRNTRPLE
jgi:hypothetical protein